MFANVKLKTKAMKENGDEYLVIIVGVGVMILLISGIVNIILN